jgi:universal stress protein A
MKTKISKKRTPPSFESATRLRLRAAGPRIAQLKRILVPTDFSKPSLKALSYAVRFAEQSGATIDLAYVIEMPPYVNDFANCPLLRPQAELTTIARDKLLSIASSQIEELVPVKTHVCIGQASREIVQLARKTEADLIVIATHGRTGFSRVLLGSTAELVVRNAPCPVLVVREKEREFVQ